MAAATFEPLAWGYGLPEAPCCDASGRVWFSDVLGGGIHRWSPDAGAGPGGRAAEIVPKRRGIGGMALHARGGVVASGRDLTHFPADGKPRVLLAAQDGDARGVAGFNDLCADSAGRLWAGALRFFPFKGEPPVPGDLWRLDRPGRAERVSQGVDWPNGVGVSPDGGDLYLCDYAHAFVLAFEIRPDGGVEAPRVLARAARGSCDGLAVDERGGIWVALGDAGAVARFDPGGTLDRVLEAPSSFVTSLCFGGDDMRDLYVTAANDAHDPARGGTLFRTRVDEPGLPVAPATV